MRVLIATDGSKEALLAMHVASHLLSETDRQVDVLYVTTQPRAVPSKELVASAYERRIVPEAFRILQEAQQALREEGIEAGVRYTVGSPAQVLLQETGNYDVTVIGAKGRNVASDVGLGPVAGRLIEHASGCVLVGREFEQERGARILAPVDGSDGSRQALDVLPRLFDLASAEITLLHVVETQWLGIEAEQGQPLEEAAGDVDEASLLVELRREGEQVLSRARDRMLACHAGITTLLREGDPANEILSEAEQGGHDLVLLGASGSADLKHRILGSVSSKVAWNASCSVLLVRG